MRPRIFNLLAIASVFLAYTITIRLALSLDLAGSLLGGIANTVPVVIFGMGVRRIVVQRLVGRPLAMQLTAHLLLCAAFATLSYGLLIVLLGLFNGAGPEGFAVKPFSASGTAWQSLENVTTYALIAAIAHLQIAGKALHLSDKEVSRFQAHGGTVESAVSPSGPPARDDKEAIAIPAVSAQPDAARLGPEARTDPSLSRYFVRIGDELRPLDIDTIISIRGADDYAEVRTPAGTHLVRVTLAEFAQSLDSAKYVRVHRSWIVNTHRIARAESAGGGRLLLHMENDQTISTSRGGARQLRGRVL
jgi:LytTr DNA-binding domain-containing protein